MQALSDDQWFDQLDEGAKDRVRRIVGYFARRPGSEGKVRSRVRADAEARHAQIAYEELLKNFDPSGWLEDSRLRIDSLVQEDFHEGELEYAPGLERAQETVAKMIANGSSYEDLAAFAYLVVYNNSSIILDRLFQDGDGFSDQPGWRLMETWQGKLTGRPLSQRYVLKEFDKTRGSVRNSCCTPRVSACFEPDGGAVFDGVTFLLNVGTPVQTSAGYTSLTLRVRASWEQATPD